MAGFERGGGVTGLTRAALMLLWGNRAAIRTRLLPGYLVWMLCAVATLWLGHGHPTAQPLTAAFGNGAQPVEAQIWFALVLNALCWAVFGPALAVTWRRIVLAPGAGGAIARPVLSYLAWALLLGLMAAVIFAVTLIWPALAHVLPARPLLLHGLGFVSEVLTGWMWFRLGLVLPAAAIGARGVWLHQSWRGTAGRGRAILFAAVVQALALSGMAVVGTGAALLSEAAALAVSFVLWPVPVLFGLAVLTILFRERENP